MSRGWLAGYRVLDLTDERGLLAGRMLADLGADVVAVEPPQGSSARRVLPRRESESLYWATYGANRRSVVVDPADPTAATELLDLVASADFLFETDGSLLDELGVTWEQASVANPQLIWVSTTDFGATGPKAAWPATELTLWAAGGALAYNQDGDRPPLRLSVPQAHLHAAADAAGAAMVAHEARKRTGRGQRVDLAVQATLGLATLAANLTAATGDADPEWMPRPGSTVTIDLSGSGSRTRRSKWRLADGWAELHLAMGPATGSFTNNFIAWVNDVDPGRLDPDAATWDWRTLPDRIRSREVTGARIEEVRSAIADFFETRTKGEVTEAAVERKVLAVGIADVADLVASPQLADRDFLVTVGEGEEAVTMPGPFARVSIDAFGPRRPAPRIGAHTAEVGAEWAQARPAPPASRSAGGAGGALGGLKVADLSWVVAGPVVGRVLADFGATVVRVESSTRIETARHMSPFYGGVHGPETSALYQTTNAGKLGVAADLSTDDGRAVAADLIRWADVVVESYRPGQMARWGLGYEQLRAERPDLIMLSTSLMGQTGPLAKLAGYGNVGAAMSGFQQIVGWPDRPPLGPFGPYTDYIGPRFSLVALLAALDHRDRTGEGCHLDVSQVEAGVWFLAPEIADFVANGVVAERDGNRDRAFAPHGVFACAPSEPGQSDYVAIAVRTDHEWAALAAAIGTSGLAGDGRFATAAGRRDHAVELESIIASWTGGQRAADVEGTLIAAGVPAHRAAKSADVLADAQLAHLGHFVRLEHPELGTVTVEGSRFALSDTPAVVERVAPSFGRDNRAVLGGLLGYDDARIDRLEQEGALR